MSPDSVDTFYYVHVTLESMAMRNNTLTIKIHVPIVFGIFDVPTLSGLTLSG